MTRVLAAQSVVAASLPSALLVLAVLCPLSCRGAGVERASARTAVYDGTPPPSFVLRKFGAPETQPPTPPAPASPVPYVRPCADGPFALRELAVKTIALSNQDIESAMTMLGVMGYSTVVANGTDTVVERRRRDGSSPEEVGDGRFACAELPVVMLNWKADGRMSFSADALSKDYASAEEIQRSHSSDVDRLTVFYHPDQGDELARLEELLRDAVDVAAPQVFIEAWVLEVSEEDSRELGLRYTDTVSDSGTLSYGSDSTDPGSDVFDYFYDEGSMLPEVTSWKIRALAENGKAEILSRPSLLALSNRQALIQVLDVIPSPSQDLFYTDSSSGSNLGWADVQIGITLNLRPRVSADRRWVSLEIDALVDSEDEENSGEAVGVNGNGDNFVIGTRPAYSSRRVKTFARIPDRTPIIIGGLVSKENSTRTNRLPGLGDAPVVGPLFGASDWDVTQREIMIILTPYVLAEDAIGVATNTPKESSRFDDLEMELFDDRYRLRAEDLFDLGTITRTPRFLGYLRKIQDALQRTPRDRLEPHYTEFLGGNFPGGEALVARTFFDLAQKLPLTDRLDLRAVRVSLKQDRELHGTSLSAVLDRADGRPVVLRSQSADSLGVVAEIADQPPEDTEAAVVLGGAGDVDRFATALVARELIRVNGGLENLRIRNLEAGQFITLPSFAEGEEWTVDLETLRTHQNSLDYERVVFASLEEAFRRIDGRRR